MNQYVIKSLISLASIVSIFIFRNYITSIVGQPVAILMLILSWALFIGYTMAIILSWYKSDLAKRTQKELKKQENNDKDDEDSNQFIPLFN